MSFFVGWFEKISGESAVIEREIEQMRELCRDITKRIGCVERLCGKRFITDATKESLNEASRSLEDCITLIKTEQTYGFDAHWKRNGDYKRR